MVHIALLITYFTGTTENQITALIKQLVFKYYVQLRQQQHMCFLCGRHNGRLRSLHKIFEPTVVIKIILCIHTFYIESYLHINSLLHTAILI